MNLRRTAPRRAAIVACLVLPAALAFAVDRDGDGGSWPSDCNDGNDRVAGHPMLEYCDGWANSCGGVADAGCLRACPSPRPGAAATLGSAPGASSRPRVAPSNKGFDVVWTDSRDGNQEIYLSRLDPFGSPLYPERRLTAESSPSTAPAIASPGGWRGVAWVDERDRNPEIYFSRISDSGLGDASEIRVTRDSADDLEPALAWAGRQWAIAWANGRHSYAIHVQIVTDAGILVSSATVSGNAGSARNPSIAFTGNGYGVVWEDDRNGQTEIYFRALDDALAPTTGEIRLTNATGVSAQPSIVWAGDRFAVGWRDERNGNSEAYVAMFDTAGQPIGAPLRLTTSASATEAPRLAWTAGEILVAWIDAPAGMPQPFLARVRPDGTLLEAGRAMAPASAGLTFADVAWDGVSPFLVWEATPSGEIHAERGRCCGDLDGDGVDRCDGDCDDGDPAVHPGAPETCNGRDDDCNGQTDEGCDRSCAGPDLTAPVVGHLGGSPIGVHDVSLASNGASIGAAWSQREGFPEQIFVQHLAPDGTPLAPPVPIGNTNPSIYNFRPAIASRPGGWALLYEYDAGLVSLELLDGDGASVRPATRWAAEARMTSPGLVWNGRELGIVYESSDTSLNGQYVYFARLSSDGTLLASPIILNSPNGTDGVALGWTGTEYWVVSSQFGSAAPHWSLYLDRFDAEGRRIVSGQRILDGGGVALSQPSIAWTGSNFLLSVVSNNSVVLSGGLDMAGFVYGLVQVTFDGHLPIAPRLAWNGAEGFLQWTDPDARATRAVLVDSDGMPVGGIAPVSSRDGGSPAFNATGVIAVAQGWLSGWAAVSASPVAMDTRLLGCCRDGDPDADGDFYCAGDCGPHNAAVNPAAPEVCDGLDNDCNSKIDDLPAPVALPGLSVGKATGGAALLSWPPVAGATAYDLLRGSLSTLHGSGGDYSVSSGPCLGNNLQGESWTDGDSAPAPGFWYLLRAVTCITPGTWNDSGPGRQTDRDGGIALSPDRCP